MMSYLLVKKLMKEDKNMDNEQLKKEGYWAIASQKHLKEYKTDSPNIEELGEIGMAGKAGILMGVIRGNGKIENIQKIEKMATQAGIASKYELKNNILPLIENASDKQVELIRNNTGEIIGLEENIFDSDTVFNITGKLFENLEPSDVQRIAIATMDETKKIPYLHGELLENMCGLGFSESDIELALKLEEQFKILRRLEQGTTGEDIYSNEYIWGKDNIRISRALAAVDSIDRKDLSKIIETIQGCQGIPIDNILIQNHGILLLAKKIGMIAPIQIATGRNVNHEFAFSPNMLEPITNKHDILDDVKLLLASIRFGENYTNYSTIYDAERFLQSWIDSGEIGPHSANETDYIMLERKGIVKVERKTKIKVGSYGAYNAEGYYLKLIKKDVAKEALKYIQSTKGKTNNILNENNGMSSLEDITDYRSPEAQRIMLGEMPHPMKELDVYMQQILRDEVI